MEHVLDYLDWELQMESQASADHIVSLQPHRLAAERHTRNCLATEEIVTRHVLSTCFPSDVTCLATSSVCDDIAAKRGAAQAILIVDAADLAEAISTSLAQLQTTKSQQL